MLGSPCSPCCEQPVCTSEQRQAIYEDLRSRTCTVTLTGSLPVQDAATTYAVGNAGGPTGAAAAAALAPFFAEWRLYQQSQSPIGQRALALVPNSQPAVFAASGPGWNIAVTLWLPANSSTGQFQYPGTGCNIQCQISVQQNRNVAITGSGFAFPSGVSTLTRTLPYLVNGQSATRSLAVVNAPYYRTIFRLSTDYVMRHGSGLTGFLAAWDSDLYHSQASWSFESVGTFGAALDVAAGSGTQPLTLQAGPLTPSSDWSINVPNLSRWRSYSSPSSPPDWISNLSAAQQMDANSGNAVFVSTYNTADRHYAAESPAGYGITSATVVFST